MYSLKSVTLGYAALKDMSADNHNDDLDGPLDIHSDMISISTPVAPASEVKGSKVGVTSSSTPVSHTSEVKGSKVGVTSVAPTFNVM